MRNWSKREIIKPQRHNPVLRRAMECIRAGEAVNVGQHRKVSSHLNLQDGVL